MLDPMTALNTQSPHARFLCRGSAWRKTNLQEELQNGLVTTIAAAAGCQVSRTGFDEGIDLTLTHSRESIIDQQNLHLQLKATTNGWNAKGDKISAQLTTKRYDEMRSDKKTFPWLLVIMDVNQDVDNWYLAKNDGSHIQHNCYWADLTGFPPTTNEKTITVHAPKTNIFDDAFLVDFFAERRTLTQGKP